MLKTPRPLAPSGGNDCVYTPDNLATQIVEHFHPKGSMLEPCMGRGSFVRAFRRFNSDYGHRLRPICAFDVDSDDPIDFLDPIEWQIRELPERFDWIITNPPWSQFRAFMVRAMETADNVVFLALLNAWFMRARVTDVRAAGFGYVEALMLNTPPKPWPQTGFQLAAVHIQRGYVGPMRFTHLETA